MADKLMAALSCLPKMTYDLPADNSAGTGGFIINGESANDYSGWSVSNAGEVNRDGFEELIENAWGAGSNNKYIYIFLLKNCLSYKGYPLEWRKYSQCPITKCCFTQCWGLSIYFFSFLLANSNGLVWFMVFNTTFNNISVISWPSVLLAEETLSHNDVFYWWRKPEIIIDLL
jgi:hypothetical protein